MRCAIGARLLNMAAALSISTLATTAAAQTPVAASDDPNPGAIMLTESFDGVSTYMFRGIRQNATGIALWPVVDAGIANIGFSY